MKRKIKKTIQLPVPPEKREKVLKELMDALRRGASLTFTPAPKQEPETGKMPYATIII